ncbi:hypothetical protein OSB04_024327 [Centaurea solstitialis]|uniref:Uncharacterized protein n=1 Tax=Centaurea solstitialis TaxID=347529 RepID=A0AA38SKW1_9ASTR|nr:hypothetical protein OSB04_024327 [Centaurea solstitialis]
MSFYVIHQYPPSSHTAIHSLIFIMIKLEENVMPSLNHPRHQNTRKNSHHLVHLSSPSKEPSTIGRSKQPRRLVQQEYLLRLVLLNAPSTGKVKMFSHKTKPSKGCLHNKQRLCKRKKPLFQRYNIIDEIRVRMQRLHEELLRIVQTKTPAQTQNVLASKEEEMEFLKSQLVDLERQHKQQRMSMRVDDPWRLPTTPFVGTSFNPQPLPLAPTSQKTPCLSLWSKEQEKKKLKKSTPPQAFENNRCNLIQQPRCLL